MAVITSWMIRQAVAGENGLVLDPFAGSGTSLGEALRLGHRAIGIEINPFAAALMKEAFAPRHRDLEEHYVSTIQSALNDVEHFYGGPEAPAGYFWAYQQMCHSCQEPSLLLKRLILVQHAYPKRSPGGWVLCPYSRDVFGVDDVRVSEAPCPCGRVLPLKSATGAFRCTSCHEEIRPGSEDGTPFEPSPVLVAVERRDKDGRRLFGAPLPCEIELAHSADSLANSLKTIEISHGRSTRQILGWGYRNWDDLFHPRQRLLAYAISSRVASITNRRLREQLALAFSPFVEYHCRLTSFKGLGTGSVRQAFGRPMLHPVSLSFEVNPLIGQNGVKTSGNPRSWYYIRTKPAADAYDELVISRGHRVKLGHHSDVADGRASLAVIRGDSRSLSLRPLSVDAIVTDPPYFNRLHYDDLAGALNAWLIWCGVGRQASGTGIQSDDRETFSEGLLKSFRSSLRALKPRGNVIFTFHHQDLDAWVALAQALAKLPLISRDIILVPAEMLNSLAKQRALTPISCDVILHFVKARRDLTLKNAVHRATQRALRALAETPSILTGDIASAAYGAGVLVGLRSRETTSDWEGFLRAVADRVAKAFEVDSG